MHRQSSIQIRFSPFLGGDQVFALLIKTKKEFYRDETEITVQCPKSISFMCRTKYLHHAEMKTKDDTFWVTPTLYLLNTSLPISCKKCSSIQSINIKQFWKQALSFLFLFLANDQVFTYSGFLFLVY